MLRSSGKMPGWSSSGGRDGRSSEHYSRMLTEYLARLSTGTQNMMWTGPDSRPPSLRHLCSGKGDEEQHQPPALVCREHPGDRHSRICEAGRTMGVSITPQGEDAGCSDSRPCVAGAWFWVNTWGKRGAQGEHRTAPPLHPHLLACL